MNTRLESEELDLSFFSLTTSEETAKTVVDRRARGEMGLLTEKSFVLMRRVDPRKVGGLRILVQASEFSTDLAELMDKG